MNQRNKKIKQYAEHKFRKKYKEFENKFGKGEQTNYFLNKIGKAMFNRRYKGTYPSDMIPQLNNDEYAILNLDDSTKSGSHWVAIAKQNNEVYIYDSFGRKIKKIIPSVVSKYRRIKMTESDKEQDEKEYTCSLYCLAWLYIVDELGFKFAKWI